MTHPHHCGESAQPQCWCHQCRPITFNDMRMIVCPDCGDKRCIHAYNHAAPCAKTDLYAHNSWVEWMMLRTQPRPENDPPDVDAVVKLGDRWAHLREGDAC